MIAPVIKYTVYQITNIQNGMIYIGVHKCKCNPCKYMGSGKILKYAIRKYGMKNFNKEILFEFNSETEMSDKEKELVTETFCNRDDTYNIAPGGFGGGYRYANLKGNNNIGWKTNVKGSLYLSRGGKKGSAKTNRKGFRNKPLVEAAKTSFLGKTHTDEWKENHSKFMKENQKGSKNSQFGTMWITNGTENRKIKKDLDSIPEGWYKGRR